MNAYAIPGITRTVGEYCKTTQLTKEQLRIKAERAVCDVWGIDPSLLHGKTRRREVVEARQVLFTWLLCNTQMSLSQVGAIYDKDHSTVVYSRKAVKNLVESNLEFREKYESAIVLINNN